MGVGEIALDNKGMNKLGECVVGVALSMNEYCSNEGVGDSVGTKVYAGVAARLSERAMS